MSQTAPEVDESIVRRARRGDTQAFEVIYQAYAGRCYNLALRMTGSKAIAEDVVHDTFVKIMRRIKSFRGEASLWSWIRTITANTTINDLNRRKWWRSLDHGEESGQIMPSAKDERGAHAHDIASLLQNLSVQARSVLLLHDMEGMTHKEIASMFGQTESFSKSILHRARKQLEDYLSDDQ